MKHICLSMHSINAKHCISPISQNLNIINFLGRCISVPFNFDIHAMIFSDNAPALETALHRAFENKKLNMVDQCREFFNVTLNEIKAVVMKNFDKSVEFIEIPEAEQYRTSLKMKENK
ncbi:MAG: GIY-YIG nuclease family protein [Clostridia bacterium]|nr:GIY-YIG nuclease family protein [Clostridia bacterium]